MGANRKAEATEPPSSTSGVSLPSAAAAAAAVVPPLLQLTAVVRRLGLSAAHPLILIDDQSLLRENTSLSSEESGLLRQRPMVVVECPRRAE